MDIEYFKPHFDQKIGNYPESTQPNEEGRRYSFDQSLANSTASTKDSETGAKEKPYWSEYDLDRKINNQQYQQTLPLSSEINR